jgi:hypothetical protein
VTFKDVKIKPILDSLRLEDISDAIYFSEKYSDYVSNSRLSYFNPEQEGSPEKYFNERPSLYLDSLVLGGALHSVILQPESYLIVDDVNRPTAKAGFMADELYKPGKLPTEEEYIAASDKIDYYKGKMNSKKIEDLKNKCVGYWRTRAIWEDTHKNEIKTPIFLDEKKRDAVAGMLDTYSKYDEFHKLLNPEGILEKPITANEQTILLDVEASVEDKEPIILRLKSKLDNYTINTEENIIVVNDLKTSSKPINMFKSAFNKYHYYRELGMYLWLLSLCAKKFYNLEKPTMEANCLVLETFPQYNGCVYPLTNNDLQRGFNEFKTLLKLVAYYKFNGW